MKFLYRLLLIMIMVCFIVLSVFCSKKENTSDLNIISIHNSKTPKNGTIELELEKIRRISSKHLSDVKSYIFFRSIIKDKEGNLYLVDYRNIKINKIDRNGNVISSFLRKGDGPGELHKLYKVDLINGTIICSNRNKFCCFDLKGNLISEKKLKVQSHELLEHIDEKRYITYNDIYKNKKKIGVSITLNEDDRISKELYRKYNPDIGYSMLRIGKKIFKYLGNNSPRMEYNYNFFDRLLYVAYNFENKIYALDLNGSVKKIIQRDIEPIKITRSALEYFAESFKKMGWSPNYVQAYLNHPPEKFWPIIARIRFLPSGYIGVSRPIARNKRIIDVFNSKGEYVYKITGVKDMDAPLNRLGFYKDCIGLITHSEEEDVYTEYKVRNLPLIYNKK